MKFVEPKLAKAVTACNSPKLHPCRVVTLQGVHSGDGDHLPAGLRQFFRFLSRVAETDIACRAPNGFWTRDSNGNTKLGPISDACCSGSQNGAGGAGTLGVWSR
jgi:hypothetical protein